MWVTFSVKKQVPANKLELFVSNKSQENKKATPLRQASDAIVPVVGSVAWVKHLLISE